MANSLASPDIAQRIADTERHLKDGLITKREARRKIAELKAKLEKNSDVRR